ncbi:MAG TPA: LysR substrate-binding domain-containing protein [Solirubrobacterales bacterium]|nr:LysR substrate-binding domain-containing protein [Solirubrobacterales bacterium]
MELRHLRYFVAVAEELHFRRAAERLHVAQPAVSEQVRKLEQELGVDLLDRTPRKVTLTDAGAAMLEESRRVLLLAERARQSARNAHCHADARLRVGYAATALPASVLRALRAVRASACCTEASLRPGSATELLQGVRDGSLDAALVPLPAPAFGLRVTRLADQHTVAALPAGHACAARSSVPLEHLVPHRITVLPREENRPFYDAVLGACHQVGISPTLVEQPGVEQVVLAVAAGEGLALLPDSVVDRYVAPGVRFVPLEDPHLSFSIGVATPRDHDHEPTAFLLRGLARATDAPPAQAVALPRPAMVAAV